MRVRPWGSITGRVGRLSEGWVLYIAASLLQRGVGQKGKERRGRTPPVAAEERRCRPAFIKDDYRLHSYSRQCTKRWFSGGIYGLCTNIEALKEPGTNV